MNLVDLRKKNDIELQAELVAAEKAVFGLRMQRSVGSGVKDHEIRKTRKLVAQIKTLVSERGGSTNA